LLLYTWYLSRIKKIKAEEYSKSEYKKQLAELEMKALRAQMNPHFIFNSLNSIQKFIFDKDEYAASQYLTKFSRLIRLILEQSDQNYTTISSEIELIKLYIEMEVLRFDKSFTYQLEIDPDIDQETIIPSMIIQPHIENAIWHGILHLSIDPEELNYRKGLLILRIYPMDAHNLAIEIQDNGVGRAKSLEYKSKQLLKKKSYGTNITADRIKIYNDLKGVNTTIETTDLTNDDGLPCGTLVRIILPVNKNI
jgi:LytS/YehU family sensor histidine kinase